MRMPQARVVKESRAAEICAVMTGIANIRHEKRASKSLLTSYDRGATDLIRGERLNGMLRLS